MKKITFDSDKPCTTMELEVDDVLDAIWQECVWDGDEQDVANVEKGVTNIVADLIWRYSRKTSLWDNVAEATYEWHAGMAGKNPDYDALVVRNAEAMRKAIKDFGNSFHELLGRCQQEESKLDYEERQPKPEGTGVRRSGKARRPS